MTHGEVATHTRKVNQQKQLPWKSCSWQPCGRRWYQPLSGGRNLVLLQLLLLGPLEDEEPDVSAKFELASAIAKANIRVFVYQP